MIIYLNYLYSGIGIMYAFDFNEYLQYSTVQYIYSNLILLLHEYNSLVSNVE